MKEEKANKIYDLLVSIGGANESDRSDFIFHHCTSVYGCSEYRFQGKLGFGGKYRSGWNGVTCYHETETEEIRIVKELLNEKLKAITD